MKPILFTLGPLHLYSFGLMVALGVLISIFLARRRAARTGVFPSDTAVDLIFVTVFAGFAGGRLFYLIQNWSWYASRPLEIFAIWEGGLIFYGGVAGSLAGLWIFTQIKKNSTPSPFPSPPWGRGQGEGVGFLQALDFLLPYVALTHGFGRIGCFLNGCCYGKVCALPWAVKFPNLPEAVHPTQLYEAAFLFSLFFFLNACYPLTLPLSPSGRGQGEGSARHFVGEITVLYFIFYSAGRFVLEFFRGDNPSWGPLTSNQWGSVGIFVAALVFYHLFKRR